MSKGENIFKRKDGRWEARYVKGRNDFGKILYGFCYGKTYREAKDKVNGIKAELINNQSSMLVTKKTLSIFCDEWLIANSSSIKESTKAKYISVLDKHIKPSLGRRVITDLSEIDIQNFTSRLLSNTGLSVGTARTVLVILRSILRYAAKHIPAYCPPEVAMPKESKTEMRVMTTDEQNRLVQYLLQDMDDCKFGILLAVFTGLRIGEICALRWRDISLPDKALHVRFTMQRIQNLDCAGDAKTKVTISPPKSNTSLRIIPLPDFLVELCRKRLNPNTHAFILTGTEFYMEPRALQYRFRRYTDACELEGIHFHTIRHTFATRCVEIGFEIKSLSEILGHSSTKITLDRYIHSSMELKRKNMNKLNKIDLK